ncbi:MAG: murein biosynthesis integral membrane protein MurJ [Parcubacteria group bacterium]
MVKKVIKFFYLETAALHKAAYLLGFFAILSQVLAFLRDRLLAHTYGAGQELDLYYAAFRIPDFIFVAIASVVSLSVLVPFIIEKEKNGLTAQAGKEEVKKFIDDITSFFSILIFCVSVLAFFLIPSFSSFLFKGFSGEELSSVIFLSRIMLLSPIFLGFSNLLGSLTQAYNRFIIYAFAPLLYNAGIIIGIFLLSPRWGINGVAMGVVLGAILHLLVQVPFVTKLGLFPKPKLDFNWSSVKRVATLSLPRTLSLSTSHIATLFLISIASLMAAGSISIYSFALNIQSVPLSIIGVSYSLAAFPTLSRHYADKNIKAFVSQMAVTTRHIIFWTLPAMALFIMLRAHVTRVLLGSGLFDWNDTRLTAAALALFSISALSQSLLMLFTRAFYSAGRTRKPFLINLISTLILIIGTYGLVKLFNAWEAFRYFIGALLKVDDLTNTAVLMLPLGFSLGIILNSVVHWISFEKDFGGGFTADVKKTFFDSFSASVIMGAATYVGLNMFAPILNTTKLWGIFLQGFMAGMLGIMAGVLVLLLLKNKELEVVWESIHARFWKAKVIATDPEII